MEIFDKIKKYLDFPKQGITFYDLNPIYADAKSLASLVSHAHYALRWKSPVFDVICGIESRGFILGSAMAAREAKGFIPIRKLGKLPGEVFKEKYDLEYGEDCLCIQKDNNLKNKTVLIVDDVLATGGTLKSAVKLLRSMGAKSIIALVVLDLGISNIEDVPADFKMALETI